MSSASMTGTASSGIRQVELSIQGMMCAACAARVKKKLAAIDDVLATVNFATEKATVTVPATVPVQQLIEQIEQDGYGAELVSPAASGRGRRRPALPTSGAGCRGLTDPGWARNLPPGLRQGSR
jgi:cation transport ATPase